MRRLNNDQLLDLAETLSGPPSGGWFQRWIVGIGLATVLIVSGIVAAVTSKAWVLNMRLRGTSSAGGLLKQLEGEPATAAGLFFVALGLFVHVHWFWGSDKRLQSFYGWYELGKIITFIAMIFAIGWGVYCSLF